MTLAFHFLGSPQLISENLPVSIHRRSVVALLAYLSVDDNGRARQVHTRESLSALLWPDTAQAKAFTNLRHTLWEIQKAFGQGLLITNRETISLHMDSNLWVDVRRFESLLHEGSAQNDVSLRIPLLAESVQLYRHHFLTGFTLKNAPTFSDWSQSKADGLRLKLTQALIMLADDYCMLRKAETAIPYARRRVELDRLNESAHVQLMQIYIQSDQHSAALKQYQACEQILRKELNLDPQPETRELYKQIRKGEIKYVQPALQKETMKPQNNLPHRLTTFIGREQERAEIMDMLATHRLVTLTGAGGVGKTRLSQQIGAEVLAQYPDGVWFVELAPLADPALIPQTILAVLHFGEQPGKTPLQVLEEQLIGKKLLLIIDNCEHLIEASAKTTHALLMSAPELNVFVTSREALGVEGELAWTVPSLTVPDLQSPGDIEQLTQYESVRLFIDRACLVQPHFNVDQATALLIAQICSRLDGIPLAIELAAARVKSLTVDQICERLNDRFRLLTGGSRTGLERHQTLRATIDWSYNLLAADEKILLRRLSVFMGSWALEAAEQVCVKESGEFDVLDALTRLIDKSLVIMDGSGHEARYHLLETTRQYAREKLFDSGEYTELRNRHSDVYLAFVERIEPEFIRAQQKKWLDAMESEIDNLRFAIRWSIENSLAEQALRFCSASLNFWNRRGHHAEALALCKDVLNCIQEYDTINTTALHASVVAEVWWFKRIVETIHWSAPSILPSLKAVQERFEALNDYNSVGSVVAFLNLWEYFVKIHDFASAENCIRAFATSVKQAGYPWGIANSIWPMGQLLIAKGDVVSGLAWLQDALDLYVQIEDVWSAQQVSNAMMYFKILRGELDEAMELSKQLLLFYDDYGDLHGVSSVYIWMGDISLVQGKYETAHKNYSSAADCMRENYDPWIEFDVVERKSQLFFAEGNLSEASAGYRKLIIELRKAPNDFYIGIVYVGLARVQMHENCLQDARENLSVGLEVLQKTSPEDDVHKAYFGLGELARLEHNYPEALKSYRAALRRTNNFLNYISFSAIVDGIAKTECLQSNFHKAADLFGASENLRKKMGAVIYPVERPDYDKHIELLISQMDAEDFESAWNAGTKMSIEDVYCYAMED